MTGNFKIIILVVFILAGVFGLLVFSGAIPIGEDENQAKGTVVLWGTVRSGVINRLLEDFNRANTDFTVKYEEKSSDNFDQDLLEALASGRGPDMFIITDDLIYKYNNKILPIPYQSFPLNTFKTTFLGAGEIFLSSKGVLAFPLATDPMMMYYNRSVLDEKGIVSPPAYWDELTELAPTLTEKDDRGFIKRSMVAMGQYSNIFHAKDILAALFMQSGTPIIKESNGSYYSSLSNDESRYNLGSVLKFYTNFADPLNGVYSWNKSFGSSLDAFTSLKSVFYFGYASELPALIKKNPNMNFFVASVPQIRNGTFKLTNARTLGIAISQQTKNFNTAFVAGGLLTKGTFAKSFAEALSVAPVRRDLISTPPQDAFSPLFYASAFYAKSWVDPSSKDTDDIWRGMIEKVLSNGLTPEEAIKDANAKMNLLLIR